MKPEMNVKIQHIHDYILFFLVSFACKIHFLWGYQENFQVKQETRSLPVAGLEWPGAGGRAGIRDFTNQCSSTRLS